MDNLVGFELPNLDRLLEYLPNTKSMLPTSGQIFTMRLNGKYFPDLLCTLSKGDDEVTKVCSPPRRLVEILGETGKIKIVGIVGYTSFVVTTNNPETTVLFRALFPEAKNIGDHQRPPPVVLQRLKELNVDTNINVEECYPHSSVELNPVKE